MSICNKIARAVWAVAITPFDILDGEGDYESTGPVRSSRRSSSGSSSGSRDEEPDHNFFWSELSKRVFRDDRDSDYGSALAQEQDFYEFSQTYYPRKWLEEHGVWGAGEQSRYRQERYREHLRTERTRGKTRKTFWMTTLAVLATAGALFCYFKTKATTAETAPPIPIQIKSVEKPKMNLTSRTGIQISSVERPQQIIPINNEKETRKTLEEKTGIRVRSDKKGVRTLPERTGIKISSECRLEPIFKKQEHQNS